LQLINNLMHIKLPNRQTKSSPKHWTNHILQDFSRSLLLVVDPGSLQASIAARLTELSGCDRVVLFQLEAGRAVFAPHFSSGVSLSELDGFQLRRRGSLAKWLLVNETCLVISKAPGIYQYLGDTEREMLARMGVQVCIPLISLNRLIGIVMLGSADPEWQIGDEDIELLKSLAAQAALALENAYLSKQQRDRLRRIYRAESLAAAGQLAAGVAHEIRNPLTSIRSTIQYILQDYPEANPKAALLQELLSEVDRIDGTVNGLLALTRTEEFEPEPVNITEELEHSLVLIRPQAQRKGVIIEIKKAGHLRVMGVANELKQVFLNILLNALHAVPEGGAIQCECEEWTQELASASGRWAQVAISDSGVGIPPEHLDKIFDPFFTTKREGTGLGLSVCHGIIQRHDGEIDLQSTVGKGTTVSIRLPLL
jgi:two-component system, NtrC family, sensor kinase